MVGGAREAYFLTIPSAPYASRVLQALDPIIRLIEPASPPAPPFSLDGYEQGPLEFGKYTFPSGFHSCDPGQSTSLGFNFLLDKNETIETYLRRLL